MYNNSSLIPSRFLILLAHFTVCVNLLWTSQESLKSCSMGSLSESDRSIQQPHTELKIGLSVTVGLMCLEFLTFIFGLTMFNTTSALLSISGHAIACLTMTLFVIDRWQCGWFWWIFTLGSIFPVLYDIPSVLYVLYKRKW